MSRHVIITDNISRNYKRIMEIDPFDLNTIKKLEEYDKNKNTSFSKFISEVKDKYSKKEYESARMTLPVFRALYCNYDGDVISDICIAECETDLKRINVYLDKTNCSIASDLTKYAFNNLNMEQFIAFVDKKDKSIMSELINGEFIPIYEESSIESYIPFVKEKYDLVQENVICV